MFSSRGLFKNVPCPGKHNCTLSNCFFKHDFPPESGTASSTNKAYDPELIVLPESPPPPKRRRLNSPEPAESDSIPVRLGNLSNTQISKDETPNGSMVPLQPPSTSLKRTHAEASVNGTQKGETVHNSSSKSETQSAKAITTSQRANRHPISVTRTVSPPTMVRTSNPLPATTGSQSKPVKDEPFHARMIGHNPVQYGEREKKLKLFYKQLDLKQQAMRKLLKDQSDLFLTEKELQKLALDEEERTAKAASNLDTYTNLLKDRLIYYTKMTPDMYKTWVPEIFRSTTLDAASKSSAKKTTVDLRSGLESIEKEVTVLKLLRTGLHQHAKHGYVIKAPTDKEVQNAQMAEKLNKGWEACDRCQTRFQVFRGRNEEGLLTTGGQCYYHWGRISLARGASKKYPCCQQDLGSTGCQVSNHHVFKVSDAARLAALLQFKETAKHNDTKKRGPVVFDCEMGYTTCGLELIRVTALSWPAKTTLLDILVRPWGEVLDLNTRFSGVTPEIFYNAPNYGQGEHHPFPKYTPGEKLQKVASPAAARDYLFDLLDPETPLIGHAIDNDLNACRVIHPFVIDTVLLYPHDRPLPVRRKLKDLALTHLQRVIQAGGQGEVEGHDSKEDSEATGDLVLVKVKEKWEELKAQGWWWKENTLMPPTAKGKAAAGGVANL